MKLNKIFIFLFGILLFVNTVSALLNDTTKFYYSYDADDTTGTTMIDISSNGNNGTCINMASDCNTVAGLLINASDFDGTNDFINSSVTFNNQTEISLSTWFNPDTISSQRLFGIFEGLQELDILMLANGTVRGDVRTTGGQTLPLSSTTLTAGGGWFHVVMTWKRNGRHIIYINGVPEGNLSALDEQNNFTLAMYVGGANQDGILTSPVDGQMDESVVWDRELSAAEVSELYNGGNGFNPFAPNATPAIITNLTSGRFFSTNNISIQLNTTSNTNMSYVLDDSDLVVSDGLVAYYQAEENADDRTGVHNGTASGGVSFGNSVNSSYGSAFSFDGVDDTINTNIPLNTIQNNFSFNFWLNPDVSDANFREVIKSAGWNANGNFDCFYRNGLFSCDVKDETGVNKQLSVGLDLNEWAFISLISDNNVVSLYKNNVFNETETFTNNIFTSATDILISSSSTDFSGSLDDLRIYNRSLNSTERTLLFETSPHTTICNECNNSVVNFTSLSDALHNVTWFSRDIQGVEETAETFTIDTINPSLNVSLPSEFGFYSGFNFTQFINFSDTNLDSCIVTISAEPSTTCTEENYNFTFNGNHTINITVNDSAGNTNSSLNNLILINPVQNFHFIIDGNGTTITNFTFGGVNFDTVANISTYESIISLGNNTLLFEKLGFASTNVSFNVNLTSEINLTTNITNSRLIISIFDRETLALLTGLTTLTLQSDVGFLGSTTTGLINITDINFVSGAYQILTEHSGFASETVFFNYNNQANLEIDIFMLNSSSPDAGSITLIVKNSLSQLVPEATCSALEWRANESVFQSVAQGQTNVDGETILNIEIGTKIYKFSCTKQTFTTTTNAQIIQTDLSSLNIILNDITLVPSTLFSNLVGSYINTTINSTHQLLTFTFQDNDGLTSQGCIRIFSKTGNLETFVSESCLNSSTGEIISTLNINQTTDLITKATLTTSEVTNYLFDSITFKGTGSFETLLKRYNLHLLVPTILFMVGVSLGLALGNVSLSLILGGIASFLSLLIVPSVISAVITIFINVALGLIIWGIFRRR